MEPGLYIVPTPIGNLSDITLRAIDTLKSVSVIAAEDTRHSRALLDHYGIETRCVAFHEHSGPGSVAGFVDNVQAGEAVALISDAGTPLVSDPGYRLVRAMQQAGCAVVPLPGACAAITAMSGAGLPTDRFTFEGFLPAKAGQRRRSLEACRHRTETLIFYEAPHRIAECLQDCLAVFGEAREVAIARELTKTFETIRRDSLGALAAWVAADANQQRGELVLLIGPASASAQAVEPDALRLLHQLAALLPPRKAAAVVADHYGLRSRDLYRELLAHRSDPDT